MDTRKGLKWVAGEKTPGKVYITRVFNFGTDREWRDMNRRYTKRQILDAVRYPLRGQWTRRGKAFAEVRYNYTINKTALISYDT